MEIPKVIHYCWFGKTPLPELAIKCIESWKKYFPDYEIKEWNEENYDVYKIPYIREAYEAKKYAFVSDYARFDILYTYGGVYFDTDVEVIKPFDNIIENGAFMGLERDGKEQEDADTFVAVAPGLGIAANPGLGIAANPGLGIYKEILDAYATYSFIKVDGGCNMTTVVEYTTDILVKHGLENKIGIQKVAGITIYPQEYFAPKDVDTKVLNITPNTHSIHHYDASWAEWHDKRAGERGPKLKKFLGERIGNIVNVSLYVVQKYGVLGCAKRVVNKLFDRGKSGC